MHAIICLIIGLTVLLREITLTRFFSVTVNYSYTAVAISIALLGLTLGSLYYSVNARRLERIDSARLVRWLVFLAATACFVPLLPMITIPGLPGLFGPLTTTKLRLILPLTAFAPFFIEGLLLNLVLSRQVAQVRRMYFYNLCGSGLGAILAIGTLKLLGAIGSLIVCAVILAGLGLCFALKKPRQSTAWALAMGLMILASGALLNPPWQRALLKIPPSRRILQTSPEWIGWNTISRVVVSDPGRQDLFRGMAADRRVKKGPYKVASIDSIAWGPIIKFDCDFTKVSFLKYEISSLAWSLHPQPRVFIIGPAGGRDVLMSLLLGAKEIHGAEINPIFDELMLGKYYDYSGRIYSHPKVQITTDDGRSALRKLAQPFDIILFNSIETRSATERGALNLTENNIFTLQAMQEYLDHLSEHGLLAFTLISDQAGRRPVRFVSLVKAAFRSRGVKDFSRHLVVARVKQTYHYLFKRTPFTPAQLRKLRQTIDSKLLQIVFIPDHTSNAPDIQTVVDAGNDAQLADKFGFDISPPTDDRPFLFFFPLWQDFFFRSGADTTDQAFGKISYTALLTNLKIILLACSFAYILCSFGGENSSPTRRRRLWGLSLAYLLIVAGMLGANSGGWVLKFLSSPPVCLLLAAGTVLLSAKRSGLLEYLSRQSHLGPILISMILIPVVAALFYSAFQMGLLFLPLHVQALRMVLMVAAVAFVLIFAGLHRKTLFGWKPPMPRHFGYMAALGLGFLLVELAVLQKLTLLLAKPVYSLAVGLFGFLIAAGLGSYISGRLALEAKGLRRCLAGIVVILLAYALGLERIIRLSLALAYPAKILLSLGLIVPPSILMGIPFATGMSLISRSKPQHTSWLHGINSIFSVLGAALTTIISLYGGFTAGLLCGSGCYLAAFILAPPSSARAAF